MSTTAEWTGQRKKLVHQKVKLCVTQYNQQRENRLKKKIEQSFREIGDYYKRSSIHVIGVLEVEREQS